jgi:hypothetical protein
MMLYICKAGFLARPSATPLSHRSKGSVSAFCGSHAKGLRPDLNNSGTSDIRVGDCSSDHYFCISPVSCFSQIPASVRAQPRGGRRCFGVRSHGSVPKRPELVRQKYQLSALLNSSKPRALESPSFQIAHALSRYSRDRTRELTDLTVNEVHSRSQRAIDFSKKWLAQVEHQNAALETHRDSWSSIGSTMGQVGVAAKELSVDGGSTVDQSSNGRKTPANPVSVSN